MAQVFGRSTLAPDGVIDVKRDLTGSAYIPELDGLRGVAVLSVIFGHFGVPGFNVAGGYGVDVFFVLSGYLITNVLLRSIETGRPLAAFYWSRCMRLLPALVLVCASLFLLPSSYLTAWGALLNTIGALTYTTNWTRAFPVPGWPSYMAHTWSLSVEEQFYILWPAFLWGASKVKLLRPTVVAVTFASLTALAVMILSGVAFSHLYNGFDARSPAILLGSCLALARPKGAGGKMAMVASVAYIAMVFALPSRDIWAPAIWVSTMVIIDAARSRSLGLIGGFLGWKPIVSVGVISYSAYLWHFPLFYATQNFHSPKPAVSAIGILASLLLAYLTRVFVEVPALRLRGRVTTEFAVRAGRIVFVVTVLAMASGLIFFYGGFIRISPY